MKEQKETIAPGEGVREIKTVSIIGLGALGILFGHHLSKRMPKENLRIIAGKERIERYKLDGIYCNGERCAFNFVPPEEQAEPADLLIFMVKQLDLDDAIKSVRNQVGPNTIILSALNGITSEQIIGETYGMENILFCVAQGQDGIKTGNRLNYMNMGMLCFGSKRPLEDLDKVKAVEEFFTKTKLPHMVDSDMKKRLWGKFMLNVGVNQTVAVYETNYGGIQTEGEARETMIAAMREVIPLSEAEGVTLTEGDLAYWLKVLSTLNPEGKPSMRQDMEAKRCTEVELFSGTVLALGKKHGLLNPVNKELYRRIKELERNYVD